MSKLINVIDYGPKNLHLGSKFNQTKNGNNAFWIKLAQRCYNPAIIVKGSDHRISPS